MAAFGESLLDILPSSLVEVAAPGLPAALVALFSLLGGLLTHQKEGTSYALTLIGIGIIGGMNGLQPGTILSIGGATILLLAGRKFARFLSGNPVSAND